MEEAEGEEEWLLESLRSYNDLHVFELQDPTRVIEWTGEKSVCVAGYEPRRRNEILQLLLPQRLTAKENQGLCPERDFRVEHGGFSDLPVYSLKHLPGSRFLVTSSPLEDSLQVWGMEQDEADVIKPLSTIPTAKGDDASWARMATSSAWVLHGLTIGDVQVTDVESKKSIFRAGSANPDAVTTLEFLDQSSLLACSRKGQLFLADVRQSLLAAAADALVLSALGGESWCAGVGQSPLAAGAEKPLVARLSSGGHVALTDTRNMTSPVKVATCCVPTSALCGAEFLSVSLAPLLGDCVAVSGFDGTVHLYDLSSWGPSPQPAKPLFIHKGHMFSSAGAAGKAPLVTAHTWHPCKPRTLLSSASDGSLHVWDWVHPRGGT